MPNFPLLLFFLILSCLSYKNSLQYQSIVEEAYLPIKKARYGSIERVTVEIRNKPIAAIDLSAVRETSISKEALHEVSVHGEKKLNEKIRTQASNFIFPTEKKIEGNTNVEKVIFVNSSMSSVLTIRLQKIFTYLNSVSNITFKTSNSDKYNDELVIHFVTAEKNENDLSSFCRVVPTEEHNIYRFELTDLCVTHGIISKLILSLLQIENNLTPYLRYYKSSFVHKPTEMFLTLQRDDENNMVDKDLTLMLLLLTKCELNRLNSKYPGEAKVPSCNEGDIVYDFKPSKSLEKIFGQDAYRYCAIKQNFGMIMDACTFYNNTDVPSLIGEVMSPKYVKKIIDLNRKSTLEGNGKLKEYVDQNKEDKIDENSSVGMFSKSYWSNLDKLQVLLIRRLTMKLERYGGVSSDPIVIYGPNLDEFETVFRPLLEFINTMSVETAKLLLHQLSGKYLQHVPNNIEFTTFITKFVNLLKEQGILLPKVELVNPKNNNFSENKNENRDESSKTQVSPEKLRRNNTLMRKGLNVYNSNVSQGIGTNLPFEKQHTWFWPNKRGEIFDWKHNNNPDILDTSLVPYRLDKKSISALKDVNYVNNNPGEVIHFNTNYVNEDAKAALQDLYIPIETDGKDDLLNTRYKEIVAAGYKVEDVAQILAASKSKLSPEQLAKKNEILEKLNKVKEEASKKSQNHHYHQHQQEQQNVCSRYYQQPAESCYMRQIVQQSCPYAKQPESIPPSNSCYNSPGVNSSENNKNKNEKVNRSKQIFDMLKYLEANKMNENPYYIPLKKNYVYTSSFFEKTLPIGGSFNQSLDSRQNPYILGIMADLEELKKSKYFYEISACFDFVNKNKSSTNCSDVCVQYCMNVNGIKTIECMKEYSECVYSPTKGNLFADSVKQTNGMPRIASLSSYFTILLFMFSIFI